MKKFNHICSAAILIVLLLLLAECGRTSVVEKIPLANQDNITSPDVSKRTADEIASDLAGNISFWRYTVPSIENASQVYKISEIHVQEGAQIKRTTYTYTDQSYKICDTYPLVVVGESDFASFSCDLLASYVSTPTEENVLDSIYPQGDIQYTIKQEYEPDFTFAQNYGLTFRGDLYGDVGKLERYDVDHIGGANDQYQIEAVFVSESETTLNTTLLRKRLYFQGGYWVSDAATERYEDTENKKVNEIYWDYQMERDGCVILLINAYEEDGIQCVDEFLYESTFDINQRSFVAWGFYSEQYHAETDEYMGTPFDCEYLAVSAGPMSQDDALQWIAHIKEEHEELPIILDGDEYLRTKIVEYGYDEDYYLLYNKQSKDGYTIADIAKKGTFGYQDALLQRESE